MSRQDRAEAEAAWWRSVCLLRRDGRRSLTAVSRRTQLPVSTLFERLRRWPGLRRATLLVDFAQLDATQAWLVVDAVPRLQRDALESFLVTHPGVNTVQRLFTGADFLVEVVLPEARAVEGFVDRLYAEFAVGTVRVLYVLADLQREAYLTDPLHYPGLTGVPALEAVEVAR